MNRFVYLDNNATTSISSEIYEEIKPFLTLQYGNPSSPYGFGRKVREEIIKARENIAKLITAKSKQIVFNSGATEGNCSAINSGIKNFPNKKKIITTTVEHSSILEYCKLLAKSGYEVAYIPVDENGNLNLNKLEKEIDKNTAVVSIQYANNETGVVLDISGINKLISKKKKEYDFMFCMDMVQALGKRKVDVAKLKVDLASFSGHKIHALKGSGFMYVREPNKFIPMITGHQENNLRGGTENVCGIVALGKAAELLFNNETEISVIQELRNYLEEEVEKLFPLCVINGKRADRLCNTTSLSFTNTSGNELMFALEKEGICVSTGSACNSESSEPSHVLVAMRVKYPANTIRISLSNSTTKGEIDYLIQSLKKYFKNN